MALLLGKYDSGVHAPCSGTFREQLDHLVDELSERIVVCALWDPPDRYMSNIMINVETREFEPYPEGWWLQVMEVQWDLGALGVRFEGIALQLRINPEFHQLCCAPGWLV